MNDIPMFTCEFGVASLVLREIPYRQEAHILIRSTQEPEKLLAECIAFCRACGAEKIDATGDPYLERYPFITDVLRMQCSAQSLPETDAMLFPVVAEHLAHWRKLYNGKMEKIPNAATLTEAEGKKMLQKGDGYYVHRDGVLLGIGRASGDTIDAVASFVPGGGRQVVLGADSYRALAIHINSLPLALPLGIPVLLLDCRNLIDGSLLGKQLLHLCAARLILRTLDIGS